MRKLFFLPGLLTAVLLSAADLPSGYKPEVAQGGVVFTDDFSNGLKNWTSNADFKVVPGAGENGSAGVVYHRPDPRAWNGLLRHSFKGKPGEKYRAQVLCRMENVNDIERPLERLRMHVIFCQFFNEQNKEVAVGAWPDIPMYRKPDRPWDLAKVEFTVPPGTVRCAVGLCFHKKKTMGTIYFDNFRLEKIGTQKAMINPVLPKQSLLLPDGRFQFRIFDHSARPDSQLKLWMKFNGKEYKAPLKNNTGEFRVDVPAPGKYPVSVCLLDEKNRWIIGQESFTVTVPRKEDFPKGAAFADQKGILKIDGKQFLPVGIFVAGEKTMTETAVQQIRDGGFNCVMPYYSLKMYQLDSAGTKPMSTERIRKALDYLQKNNLKILFCLKEQVYGGVWKFENVQGSMGVAQYAVRQFRNHPAILGWYISDENELGDLPKLLHLRRLVSTNDPFHPVLTLTNKPFTHLLFGQTGDVLMADDYPIGEKNRPATMASIRRHFITAERDARLGVWFVPQVFHWGNYQKQWDPYRYPTEEEMRSMVLLAMNCGAKGYAFYSHTDVFYRQEEKDPGSSKKFWPQVCRTAGLLKELQEFFFVDSESLSVIREGKNFTEAKLYRSGNKILAVVTADGPGEGKARFRIPGNPVLKSRYGRTVRQKDGSYLFTGNGIASDILCNF